MTDSDFHTWLFCKSILHLLSLRLSLLFLPCGRALASDFCNFLLPFLRCNDQMLLWLFHFCGLLQRLRYPTPFQIYACKKDSHLCKSFSFISSFLSSRAASGQVLSAFVSLTSVFGMDTGDPHSCRHCFSESLFSQNHIEEVLKLFACLGVSKLRPRPISFMSLQALRLFHS